MLKCNVVNITITINLGHFQGKFRLNSDCGSWRTSKYTIKKHIFLLDLFTLSNFTSISVFFSHNPHVSLLFLVVC